jgi:hypothetical protein
MAYTFRRGDRDQPFLLPPDLRDWLPADHLAWLCWTTWSTNSTSVRACAPIGPMGDSRRQQTARLATVRSH